MNFPIIIQVHGKPQPAGSKRAFVIKKGGMHTGRAIVTDANPKARDWKIDVQHAAREAYRGEPLGFPLQVSFQFTVDRPKNHFGTGKKASIIKPCAPSFPFSKPDCTKLVRGTEDALTGLVWKDDSQIVTQFASKRYGKPGVTITIHPADCIDFDPTPEQPAETTI